MARLVAIALLAVAALAPPSAHAAAELVDFELADGIDVTDEFRADTGLFWVLEDAGYRPYVETVGAQAKSGTRVGDISRCSREHGGNACEFAFPQTVGRFEVSVSQITVHVGQFGDAAGTSTVQLEAFDENDVALTGLTPPSVTVTAGAGFKTPLSFDAGMPKIAYFEVSAPGSSGRIGIDDVQFITGVGQPSFSLTANTGTSVVRQGTAIDIPITINRLNSAGDITFGVTGLPPGVTAQFTPNPAGGNTTQTTLRLTASDTAPAPGPGDPIPEITVTATPEATAGSQPRSFKKTIRVARNFGIEIAGGATAVQLPSCLEVEVPVRIRRDNTFNGTVNLAASFPSGSADITATFDRTSVPYAGLGTDTVTMRLRVPAAMFLNDRPVTVTGTSSGVPSASDTITVDRISQSVSPTTGRGLTPRRLSPGTQITFEGGGFCAGSKVQFGNQSAGPADRAAHGPLLVADATDISADGSTMKARVPRLGTTGNIRVIQPGGPDLVSAQTFTVDSYRSRQGFAFKNFGWGNLSFGEMTDLYGLGEMFIHVNLCWPWGSCPVPSAVPDPFAYASWQVFEYLMQASGGHCFGIAWTIQQLQAGQLKYGRFTGGATAPFELADHTGPKNGLGSFLDSQHTGQTTAEFLDFYFDRSQSLAAQLQQIESELSEGRQPAISMQYDGSGHVVTAYDTESTPDGGAYVYVYDNNHPFVPRDTGPDGDGPGRNELSSFGKHFQMEIAGGRIHIDAARSRWTFDGAGWSGGGSELFAIPNGVIPGNPTLPFSLDPTTWLNLIILFGSADGAAATGGVSGAGKKDFLPALDPAAAPGSGTHIVQGKGPVVHTVQGQKDGHYREGLIVPGFAATLHDVRTEKGVEDGVRYDAAGRAMRFTGELDRPLRARLVAGAADGDSHSAEVRTNTFADGSDGFAFGRRAKRLVYSHDGPATQFSVTLGRAGRKGMPVRFESGPLRIRPGERAILKPLSWRGLDRVRLTITGPNGTRTRILRDRSRFGGRFAITRLGARKAKRGRQALVLRARFRRVPENATALAAFRVMKRGKTVDRRAKALRAVRRGKRRLQATLRLPEGRYRLRGYLTLTQPGIAADSRTKSKRIRFRIAPR